MLFFANFHAYLQFWIHIPIIYYYEPNNFSVKLAGPELEGTCYHNVPWRLSNKKTLFKKFTLVRFAGLFKILDKLLLMHV